MARSLAFGWYGGKYSHLGWLLPLLPWTPVYCEPFGGSAAVLINREPASVEIYNDIDGELVNFFRVLRQEPEELLRQLTFTPFSREEYALAISSEGDVSDLERARRFFVRARQTRTGLGQAASNGRWAHCLLTSRAGMAGAVSRWLGGIEGLGEVAQRIMRVQIEHDDAKAVIKRYASPDTLTYCDPPYDLESRPGGRAYRYEMTKKQHEQLAALLHETEGKVAISGYRSAMMDSLYSDWNRYDAPVQVIHSSKAKRQESLWTNYIT